MPHLLPSSDRRPSRFRVASGSFPPRHKRVRRLRAVPLLAGAAIDSIGLVRSIMAFALAFAFALSCSSENRTEGATPDTDPTGAAAFIEIDARGRIAGLASEHNLLLCRLVDGDSGNLAGAVDQFDVYFTLDEACSEDADFIDAFDNEDLAVHFDGYPSRALRDAAAAYYRENIGAVMWGNWIAYISTAGSSPAGIRAGRALMRTLPDSYSVGVE